MSLIFCRRTPVSLDAASCPPKLLTRSRNDRLKPHQSELVRWAVEGGRRAIFAAFGLGKSLMQLEIMRQLGRQLGPVARASGKPNRQLIVVPLTVLV